MVAGRQFLPLIHTLPKIAEQKVASFPTCLEMSDYQLATKIPINCKSSGLRHYDFDSQWLFAVSSCQSLKQSVCEYPSPKLVGKGRDTHRGLGASDW